MRLPCKVGDACFGRHKVVVTDRFYVGRSPKNISWAWLRKPGAESEGSGTDLGLAVVGLPPDLPGVMCLCRKKKKKKGGGENWGDAHRTTVSTVLD